MNSTEQQHRLESQDDFGYLTGQRNREERERQIKTLRRSQREDRREESLRRQSVNSRRD